MTIIPVQTPFLRMAGIGVENAPTDPADPHDLQGPAVHLRWSFPTRLLPGLPMPIGWPEDGFTLYRREAVPLGDGTAFDLPSPEGLRPTRPCHCPAEPGWSSTPDALRATLERVPAAAVDLSLLLDAYPLYVTLRFAEPVRLASVAVSTGRCRSAGRAWPPCAPTTARTAWSTRPATWAPRPTGVGLDRRRATASPHVRLKLNGLRIPGYTIVLADRPPTPRYADSRSCHR